MRSLDNLRLLLADINWPEITSHVSGNNWNVLDGDWLDSWHRAVYAACDAAEAEYAELRHDLSTARGALDIAVKNETAAERELYELRGKIDSMLADGKSMTDEDMLANGWVRLPVDAVGVPVNFGDLLMEHEDGCIFKVDGFKIWGWSKEWWAYQNEGVQAPVKNCTHYHAPTVDDVLREFAEKIIDSQIPSVHPTYEEAIAEYAKRLVLAE